MLLGGLVVVSLVAVVSYRRNTEIVDFNVATVIGSRVLTDSDDLAWFVDHGMPVPTSVAVGAPASPEQLLADSDFESWLHADGVSTYARFLVTHPWDTITRPLESFVSDRPPFSNAGRSDEVLLASPDAYGVGRQVIPEPVEELLFQPGSAGTVVFALALVVLLTARRWEAHGPDPRWLVPLLALRPAVARAHRRVARQRRGARSARAAVRGGDPGRDPPAARAADGRVAQRSPSPAARRDPRAASDQGSNSPTSGRPRRWRRPRRGDGPLRRGAARAGSS